MTTSARSRRHRLSLVTLTCLVVAACGTRVTGGDTQSAGTSGGLAPGQATGNVASDVAGDGLQIEQVAAQRRQQRIEYRDLGPRSASYHLPQPLP